MTATPESGSGSAPQGPVGFRNWQAAAAGRPCQTVTEVPLYSDCRFTGQITEGLGPYQLLNTIRRTTGPFTASEPALVLRIGEHLPFSVEPMDQTRVDAYHGGSTAEELTALASLSLGARLKSGAPSRLYLRPDDVVGRPFAQAPETIPQLAYSPWRRVLPNAVREVALTLDMISSYSLLDPQDAVTLVRAARLYQDGLWIAESEPALSWLMFVSAGEAAANRWWHEDLSALDVLRKAAPELADACSAAGGAQHVCQVADLTAQAMRATVKFLGFIERHHPAAFELRPSEGAQVRWDWSRDGLEGALRKIYKYRSKALHDGIPFPEPLCTAPMRIGDAPEERPLAGAAQTLGGTWTRSDLPMHLHTFEYILRGSLLKWWRDLPTEPAPAR
jgi:hypothetical protein